MVFCPHKKKKFLFIPTYHRKLIKRWQVETWVEPWSWKPHSPCLLKFLWQLRISASWAREPFAQRSVQPLSWQLKPPRWRKRGKWLEMMDIYGRWLLVGGWPTPLKHMSSSVGMIIPNIWENKTCSKPPTKSSNVAVLSPPASRARDQLWPQIHRTPGGNSHNPMIWSGMSLSIVKHLQIILEPMTYSYQKQHAWSTMNFNMQHPSCYGAYLDSRTRMHG
jgi:hypothetical protein